MSYVGIGNRQDYIADFPTQSFDGDGSTTTFTLNFEAVTGSVRVAVDNVLQPADGSSYYVNGNSLTFTSAPASGTNNISVVYLGTVRNISSVSDNAITAAKLNSAAITGQTAETSVADDDLVLIYDDSATALRKMTTQNLRALAGITEADQWRLTADITSDTDPISSNLERVDDATFAKIGTGMSVSSGFWTFPTTGLYLVKVHGYGGAIPDDNISILIHATQDNSSYDLIADASGSGDGSAAGTTTVTTESYVNVTNTSNVKVKFSASSIGSGSLWAGDTDKNYTFFTFIRLGDSQ